MNRASSQAGFTFVELTFGLAIMAVFVVFMLQLGPSSAGLTSTTLVLSRIDEAVGQTTMQVGSELRWAQPDTLLVTPENGSDRIDFVVSTGYTSGAVIWSTPTTIRYEPDPGDANGNGTADEGNLVRIQDGVTRVLCRNVVFGSFSVTNAGNRLQIQISVFGCASTGEILQRTGQYATNLLNG